MAGEGAKEARIRRRLMLLAGDLGVYLLATLASSAAQDELTAESAGRIAVSLLSFVLGWVLLALLLNLYDPERATDRKRLWRPYLAAVLSVPLGGGFRGLLLSTPVQPAFILVMTALASSLMLVWRMGYLFLNRRQSP
jgi:hypothetical protein